LTILGPSMNHVTMSFNGEKMFLGQLNPGIFYKTFWAQFTII
jgi:hypothetical protein